MRRWTCLLIVGWIAPAVIAQEAVPQIQAPIQLVSRPKDKVAEQPGTSEPLPEGAIARLGTIRNRANGTLAPNILLYSPDGKLLASADIKTIHIWDAASGNELRQLSVAPVAARGAAAAVVSSTIGAHSLVFAPDGKTVAAYSVSRIYVWDVATGRCVNDWAAPGTGIPGLAFSPDGKRLASLRSRDTGANRASITFWNPATGEQLQQIHIGDIATSSTTGWLSYSPDGRLLAVGVGGRPIYIVETVTGQVRAEWSWLAKGPNVAISSTIPPAVAFAPDGRSLFAVTLEGVGAWDTTTGRERIRFGRSANNSSLSVSGDGKLVAVRNTDGIHLYEATSGRPRLRISDANTLVSNAFALSPDAGTLAIVDRTGNLHFWNTATGHERSPAAGHTSPIGHLAFAPDGKSLTSVSVDKVCVWDVAAQKQRSALEEPNLRPRMQMLSPNGQRLAIVGVTNGVRVTDIPSGKVVRQLDDIANGPYGLTFTADTGTLAVSEGKVVKLWNLSTGASRQTLDAGANSVVQIALTLDGRRLAGLSSNGVRVWDTVSGRQIWEQVVPQIGRPVMTFSADGAHLAFGANDGQIRIYDVATGKESARIDSTSGPLTVATFSPDGKFLIAGGPERQIHVVEIATGRQVITLSGHLGAIESLAFSTDGKLLASGGADAIVILWDATRFRPTSTAEPAPEPELSDVQMTRLWDELASTDAAKAYAAMRTLAASPRATVMQLRGRLKPAESPDGQKVTRLLEELDSPRYEQREKASHELAALGDVARGALEKFLTANTSKEARLRAQELLKNLDQPARSPELLRQIRAVEVLERIGLPVAQALLTDIAKGADGALVTREAQAALERSKK